MIEPRSGASSSDASGWRAGGRATLELLQPREMAGDLPEVERPAHPGVAYHGAFGRALGRHDDVPRAGNLRGGHERHDAGYRAQRPVERELPDQGGALEPRGVQLAGRHQDAGGHGQVVAGPFLWQVRRRQVDGDASSGNLEPGVAECGAHPFASLEHGAAGQTDDGHAGQAEGNVHLHAHGNAVDADDRSAERGGEHRGTSSEARVTMRTNAGRPPARLPTNQRRPAQPRLGSGAYRTVRTRLPAAMRRSGSSHLERRAPHRARRRTC